MRSKGVPARGDAEEAKVASSAADDNIYDGDDYSEGYSSDPNYYEPDPEPTHPVEYRSTAAVPRYRHSANLSASHIAPLSVSESTSSRRSSSQRESLRNDIERENPQRWSERRPQYEPGASATPSQSVRVVPQDPQHDPQAEQQSHSQIKDLTSSSQQYPQMRSSVHYNTPPNGPQQAPQMHYPHQSYSRSRTPVLPPEQSQNYDAEQWKFRYPDRTSQYPAMSSWYWQPNDYYDPSGFEMSMPGGGHNRSMASSNRPKSFRGSNDGSGGNLRIVDPETESMMSRNENVPLLRERALTNNKENGKYQLMTPENIQKFPSLIKRIDCLPNGPGQTRSNLGGSLPKVSTAIWETEGTICLVVELQRTSVTRRYDNNMINGTKLLNASGITRGRRDGVLKGEKVRHVVKIGGMDFKGVWIPYERALSIAQAEGVLEKLYPLFVADLCPILQSPQNYSRIRQMLARSVKRNPKFQPKANRMLASIFSSESPDLPLKASSSVPINHVSGSSQGHLHKQHQGQQAQQHERQPQHQSQQHQTQRQPTDSQMQRTINEEEIVRNYMPLDQRYNVRSLASNGAAKLPNSSTDSGNSDSEYYTNPRGRNPDSR